MTQTPLLDRTYDGNYRAAAACTLVGLQSADLFFPRVRYAPNHDEGYAEIQTTVSSFHGPAAYGAIVRLEQETDASFRVIVRAAYTAEGDIVIEEVVRCSVNPESIPAVSIPN